MYFYCGKLIYSFNSLLVEDHTMHSVIELQTEPINFPYVTWDTLHVKDSYRCSHCFDLGGNLSTWQVKFSWEARNMSILYICSVVSCRPELFFLSSTFNCQFKLKNRWIHIQILFRNLLLLLLDNILGGVEIDMNV